MRKPLSKKERFLVFERDGFCCQYCGRDPVKFDIVLEVDHCISVKDGGTNTIENLITSCFDCNRGKSKKTVIIGEIDIDAENEKLIQAQERLAQIKKIKAIRKKIQTVKDKQNYAIFGFIEDTLYGYSENLLQQMNIAIKGKYNKGVSIDLLEECLDITYYKFSDKKEFYTRDFVKYFYGVLRNKEENDF